MKSLLQSLLFLCMLLAGPASAQRVAEDDAGFLRQAAHNGLAEVEASRLALQKAEDARVRAYARQMVEEHTRAHEALAQLAGERGVALPQAPDATQQAKLQALGALDGAAFDARYVEEMGVKAHEQTIALFQRGASNARDPQIKAFASGQLPVLQRHLERARELRRN